MKGGCEDTARAKAPRQEPTGGFEQHEGDQWGTEGDVSGADSLTPWSRASLAMVTGETTLVRVLSKGGKAILGLLEAGQLGF